MKLTTILLAAALMSSACYAEAEEMATCSDIASLAGAVMKNRQTGVEMAVVLELVSKSTVSDIATPMVIAAYEKPRFGTTEYQQRSISDFKNEIMLSCVKGAN